MGPSNSSAGCSTTCGFPNADSSSRARVVWRLHGDRLTRALKRSEPILVPDGERFKQLPTVTRVYDALVRANADRASTLLTFGGGVIGDMAGFAASTYLRGISLVHVPTTLLAQVDSAIGGKVGVNHPLGKNLIGAFYQPHAVLIDPSVLATLPRREFRAGLYEVIKYGMTSSAPLFDSIRRNRTALFAQEAAALTAIISESCRIKAAGGVGGRTGSGAAPHSQFRPHGGARPRSGHQVPALPSRRGGRIRDAGGRRSWRRLAAPWPDRTRRRSPISLPVSGRCRRLPTCRRREMLEAMKRDKKMVAGRLHFVLPIAIGGTSIVDDVTEKEMKKALRTVGFRA